jgi:phage terminase small subunit
MAADAAEHIRAEGAVIIDATGKQRPNAWVQVHGQCTKAMLGLASRLRLSPAGRSGRVPSRAPSYYDRMPDEDGDDIDAH